MVTTSLSDTLIFAGKEEPVEEIVSILKCSSLKATEDERIEEVFRWLERRYKKLGQL